MTKAAGLKLATWVVDDPEELVELERFELYGLGHQPARGHARGAHRLTARAVLAQARSGWITRPDGSFG